MVLAEEHVFEWILVFSIGIIVFPMDSSVFPSESLFFQWILVFFRRNHCFSKGFEASNGGLGKKSDLKTRKMKKKEPLDMRWRA